ncbi:MAG: DUF1993 family protein, partial [Candidatus Moranbacteria bacterium]|nr:DUF1993 family protein [Candidatus Moranbacteria bacterium]
MSQSLYDFSVPVFAKALTNLKAQLMKAEAFCAEKKSRGTDAPSGASGGRYVTSRET